MHLLIHFNITTRMVLNLELMTADGLLHLLSWSNCSYLHNLWIIRRYDLLHSDWNKLDFPWNIDDSLTAIQVKCSECLQHHTGAFYSYLMRQC